MSTTPNMNLTLPVPSTTPGPQWATQVNSAFNVIDQHNHTFGSGVQVPTAGLNINSDLSFNGYSAINLKGSVYSDVNGVAPTSTSQVYVNNGDLYFVDGSGTQIPITVAGSIAAAQGNISNLVAPAVAAWDIGSATFIFTKDTNEAASFDIGPVTIRRTSVSSFGVTLQPASGIATNYTLNLPVNVPIANSFLTATTGGDIGYVSQSGGITGSMIGTTTVTGSNLASATVTNDKLAPISVGSTTTGSGSTTSSTFTQLGNTSTITTVGRSGTSTIAYVLQSLDATTLGSIELKDTVDSLVTAELRMSIIDVATSTEYFHNTQSIIAPILATPGRFFRYPLSSYSGVFQIGFAGQFQLKMKARITSASGTVSIYNFRIFAYEV